MELASDFSKFLSSIQPGDSDIADAKAAHEKVRDRLRTDEESKDAHKETFLSGSYARHTAINDINDVDVICVLDLDHAITEPETVLVWLQGILNKYYSEVRLQGRSVGAKAAKGVWLDIVPSTLVAADDGPLWIPDRDAKQWVQTHPKGQIAAGLSKNKTTDGHYIHTVKLLKAWRDRLTTESCRPKSYILETLTHDAIGFPASHAAAIVSMLEGGERSYGIYRSLNTVPAIYDPGYPIINVAKRWQFSEFNDFMTQVKSAAETARQALDSSDEAASRRLWRKIFGAKFGQ